MNKFLRCLYGLGGLLALAGLLGMSVLSAYASSDLSGTITQSYNADPSVLAGMIVELKPKTSNTVIPLTSQDIRNMTGVVVPTNAAAIVLTPQSATTQQVLVAGSGHYGLLVSNQGGAIKTGDYLTISALAGIAMKASAEQSQIVGRAAGNFNGVGNSLGTVPLRGAAGITTTVAIGYIPVDVRLASNPLYKSSSLPGFLSSAANSVANKQVDPVRVYISVVMLLATIFITGSMLYGGVRSGIVATGRNPLAKKAIGRSLAQTTVAALVIMAAGVLAVYLILNL